MNAFVGVPYVTFSTFNPNRSKGVCYIVHLQSEFPLTDLPETYTIGKRINRPF